MHPRASLALTILIPRKTGIPSHWRRPPTAQQQAIGVRLHRLHEDATDHTPASKTFAEKAAWDFVRNEKPNFTLSTANPPLVFGPIVHFLNSLGALNTSNQRVLSFIQGGAKEGLPETGTYLWIDVRDLALAHVKQIEIPEAAGKRFFVTAGYFSNEEVADIIRRNFPEYADKLPAPNPNGPGGYPGGTTDSLYKYDNSRTVDVLGIKFHTLEESIVDLVKSLKAVGV